MELKNIKDGELVMMAEMLEMELVKRELKDINTKELTEKGQEAMINEMVNALGRMEKNK